jgi:hypothetical protein
MNGREMMMMFADDERQAQGEKVGAGKIGKRDYCAGM